VPARDSALYVALDAARDVARDVARDEVREVARDAARDVECRSRAADACQMFSTSDAGIAGSPVEIDLPLRVRGVSGAVTGRAEEDVLPRDCDCE
jgi:hypothetical protein